jgi:hypothetical protein
MKKLLIIIFISVNMSARAQVPLEIIAMSDTVMINDICIEHVCFGDSITKLIKHFGSPDTIIYHPSEEGEFTEPSHISYWYHNTVFYEICHPDLTDSLLYGYRVDKNNAVIVIKGVKMIIGETVIEDIKEFFPASISRMKGSQHAKSIPIYITFPSSLKPIAEGLIFQITLYFVDNILKEAYTSFYLN